MKKDKALTHLHRAAIYTRYASYGQPVRTLPEQKRICREYANGHLCEVVQIYEDTPKLPGGTGRHALHTLIRDAEAGLFDYVIVFSYTYLAHNSYDLSICLERLRRLHVRVLPAVSFPELDSPRITLQACLRETSKQYASGLAKELLRLMHEPIGKHWFTATEALPGYLLAPNKRLIPDAPAADVLRKVFDDAANGADLSKLDAYVKDKLPQAAHHTIEALLRDETYIGTLPFELIRVPNACPAIVDPAVFEAVQKRLDAAPLPANADRPRFILDHKLYCDRCAAPMLGTQGQTTNGEPFLGYRCTNRNETYVCLKAYEDKEEAERFVAAKAAELLLTDFNIEAASLQIPTLYRQEFGKEAREAHEQTTRELRRQLKSGQTQPFSIAGSVELSHSKRNTTLALADAELNRIKLDVAGGIVCTADTVYTWLDKLTGLARLHHETESYRRYVIDAFVRAAWINDNRALVALHLPFPNRSDGIEAITLPKPDVTDNLSGPEWRSSVMY